MVGMHLGRAPVGHLVWLCVPLSQRAALLPGRIPRLLGGLDNVAPVQFCLRVLQQKTGEGSEVLP